MLPFLSSLAGVGSSLMGAAPSILNLLGGASATMNAFKKQGPTAAELGLLQSIANQNRLSQAITDPNDVIMRNLSAGESQLFRQNAASSLSDLLRADRRAQLLGRRSYFNPERRDEAISNFMTEQAQRSEPMGRQNALSRIMQALEAQRGVGQNYGSLIPSQMAAAQAEQARLPNAFGMASNFAGALPGSFSSLSNLGKSLMGLFGR